MLAKVKWTFFHDLERWVPSRIQWREELLLPGVSSLKMSQRSERGQPLRPEDCSRHKQRAQSEPRDYRQGMISILGEIERKAKRKGII